MRELELHSLSDSNCNCDGCAEITANLKSSELISALLGNGVLQILSVYTDEMLDEWLEHYEEQPSSWIRSYDKDGSILKNSTYNLSAIPSLYLLDQNKIVLVKDGTDVGLIEFAMTDMMNHK